ncbi:homeobox-DDT domain protein RLT2 isoform X1 [Iris pallida]|uniref:Homeobox-DDT domain protein RLT2 isoform X1 n=1 Tax=Iris pallida TaxID=29817 RepID=A0AAX6E820_IRIPA|nr:homeobox-DDT domain protein RLT2 isoform X1 [Iris pallida]
MFLMAMFGSCMVILMMMMTTTTIRMSLLQFCQEEAQEWERFIRLFHLKSSHNKFKFNPLQICSNVL